MEVKIDLPDRDMFMIVNPKGTRTEVYDVEVRKMAITGGRSSLVQDGKDYRPSDVIRLHATMLARPLDLQECFTTLLALQEVGEP